MAKSETAIAKADEFKKELVKGGINKAELFKQGFTSEVVHTPQEGDVIFGRYLGPGAKKQMRDPDPQTGELRELNTWRVEISGKEGERATVCLIGSHNINDFFRGLTPGNTTVYVEHLGQKSIGSRRVNQFDLRFKVDTSVAPTGPSVAELEQQAEINAKAGAQASMRRPVAPQQQI